MNIVQVSDSITVGGAERLLVVFASMARARGISVTTVSLLDEPGELSYRDELISLGSKVVCLPAPRIMDLKRFAELKRFLRCGRFDLAHTHLFYGNIVGALAARQVGLPVVSTLHSTGRAKILRAKPREMLETLCLRYLSQRVIAVGYMVEEVQRVRFGHKKMDILPNGVPLGVELSNAERTRLRNEMAGGLQGPILFTAGRFAEPKALHHMVDAFASIQPYFPQAALVMAGDGPLFNQVSAQIKKLNMEKSIFLLGSRGDVPKLLASADIYVSSSIWEGLPMAILEAMMAGLSVIATGVGDIPRVVIKGTGLVVPPGQPMALADAMRRLLAEPETRAQMSREAKRQALTNYSADI